VDNKFRTWPESDAMWVSKPLYESLPYLYLFLGASSLGASMIIKGQYWPTICFAAGVAGLVAGLVVLLKRRDHRVTGQR